MRSKGVLRAISIARVLIEEPGAHTAHTLSQRFDVHKRTIYRDIDVLLEAGFDVRQHQEAPGEPVHFLIPKWP